jgi:type IV secretory pathway VirD2 relaxase
MKHQKGNQERTIQLNRQHWIHKYEDKQNKNTTLIYVNKHKYEKSVDSLLSIA